MNKFRVYRVYHKDDQVSARLEQATIDDLSAGDVVIKAVYSSVNYKDALAVTGKGKIIRRFPLIAGIDVSGHVVESNDSGYQPGDKVLVTGYDFGVSHDGGYAEYARVPAEWLVKLPATMSLFDAMALGTAGFTVALCIKRLKDNGLAKENGPIVVTGATGGVGNIAVDILGQLGFEVVAVTGKQQQSEELMALGASRIINRHELELNGPPLEKGQWAGAIDNVGGDMLDWLVRTSKLGGSVASVGLAGGIHFHSTVMPFILRGVSVLGITSSGCPTELRQQLWQRLASDLAPTHLDRIITQIVRLEELPEVFDNMLSGQTHGRTVVEIAKPD